MSALNEIPGDERAFGAWIEQLNQEARKRGYLAEAFTDATGTECWRSYYQDGFSPADALDADEAAGQ